VEDITTRMTASASSPVPHITLETRQIRRKPGSACHSASQFRTANALLPSISGRANTNAAGRPAGADAGHEPQPHRPVIRPSLASRNRGSRVTAETATESAMVASTNRATPSARRLVASV